MEGDRVARTPDLEGESYITMPGGPRYKEKTLGGSLPCWTCDHLEGNPLTAIVLLRFPKVCGI